MKSIMYHYVQKDHPLLPYFNHLDVEDFKRQLDFLRQLLDLYPKKVS